MDKSNKQKLREAGFTDDEIDEQVDQLMEEGRAVMPSAAEAILVENNRWTDGETYETVEAAFIDAQYDRENERWSYDLLIANPHELSEQVLGIRSNENVLENAEFGDRVELGPVEETKDIVLDRTYYNAADTAAGEVKGDAGQIIHDYAHLTTDVPETENVNGTFVLAGIVDGIDVLFNQQLGEPLPYVEDEERCNVKLRVEDDMSNEVWQVKVKDTEQFAAMLDMTAEELVVWYKDDLPEESRQDDFEFNVEAILEDDFIAAGGQVGRLVPDEEGGTRTMTEATSGGADVYLYNSRYDNDAEESVPYGGIRTFTV